MLFPGKSSMLKNPVNEALVNLKHGLLLSELCNTSGTHQECYYQVFVNIKSWGTKKDSIRSKHHLQKHHLLEKGLNWSPFIGSWDADFFWNNLSIWVPSYYGSNIPFKTTLLLMTSSDVLFTHYSSVFWGVFFINALWFHFTNMYLMKYIWDYRNWRSTVDKLFIILCICD